MARIDSIAQHFEAQEREDEIYREWLEAEAFAADNQSEKEPFTIVMPPPNITGKLHIGHALDLSIQDVLIRQKRMQGYESLYLPGTDHASIATEAKIVEQMREEGISKEDIGREGFLERAWAWNDKYGNNIVQQAKRLGISCDWSRQRFTLDEGLSNAVKKVFNKLYDEGLIYRGERLINWCPHCLTSISDAEVEHEETHGHFWHIKYPLAQSDDFVEIATTRPETLLGDTAVAVNPEDERYQKYVGKKVVLPLMDREIPVVADSYVDMEFGTGLVKITPAHDPNDFEVGLRHDLPMINVMNKDGSINEAGGKYQGLSREEARKAVVRDLEEAGLLIKVEDHVHQVGHCYRCDNVVEPMLSLQWFVKMAELAEPALEVVRKGDVKFVPDRFSKIYFNWMENVRDWCISRQLWWGHPIPAAYCEDCGKITVSEQEIKTCEHCGSKNITHDPDTLDTWFSSALWPFSTLGWPEETADFAKFFPTDVLVTGYDIIFFWVSRMIFSSLRQTGKAPFSYVVLHGLVRDSQGRKMSKSLGNGVDPIEVIENWGADALRFALIHGTSPGNDMRFSEEKLDSARNFTNKIWNAFRFTIMNFDEEMDFNAVQITDLQREDCWILHELQSLIKQVNQNFERFEIGLALENIYSFLWDNFCDWYIEMVKPRLYGEGKSRLVAQYVLNYVLIAGIKMLHPFMPFISEEIYKHLIHEPGQLIRAIWPEYREDFNFPEEANEVSILKEAIRGVRNIRAEKNVPPKKEITVLLSAEDKDLEDIFKGNPMLLKHLANISSVDILAKDDEAPLDALSINIDGGVLYIALSDLIDLAEELERLNKEIANLEKEIKRCEGMLANKNFTDKAPAAVVEKERAKLDSYKESLVATRERKAALEKASS